ncbi:MAG: hypothetical protein HKN25_16665 [Pyrinomonadaceae bacterium]|nr:hypothetical protein [Pyrinomonadaceae bacterium]
MRVKEVEEGLERSEADYKHKMGFDSSIIQHERKKKMVRTLVSIFAVGCALYAIIAQF